MGSDRSTAVAPQEPNGALSWGHSPSDLLLDRGSLHVWRVDLDAVGEAVVGSLDDAERDRAEQIVSPRRRLLWSRSRGTLRALLGRYLRVDPSAVELTVGEHGKPLLDASHGPAAPAFSLSHSASLALFAFVAEGEVGVDLELTRAGCKREVEHDRLSLALRRFGSGAARRLEQLDGAVREREFLRLWVRYEAERKWCGSGIGHRDDPVPRAPLAAAGDPSAPAGPDAAPWVVDLDVGPQAAAALARGSRASELRGWQWP